MPTLTKGRAIAGAIGLTVALTAIVGWMAGTAWMDWQEAQQLARVRASAIEHWPESVPLPDDEDWAALAEAR